MCKGIENYSAVLSGRAPGSMPTTLLDYFPDDFLLFVDESHVTLPQVRAMYGGDYARKKTLVEYGFRLPSAFDNRPLKFEEVESKLQPDDLRFGYARRLRAEQSSTQVARAGHPARPACWTRSSSVRPVEGQVVRSVGARCSNRIQAARARARDHADQEDGGRSDRLSYRTRALKCEYLHPRY